MPKTKTIEVDEILPAPNSGKDSKRDPSHRRKKHGSTQKQGAAREDADKPASSSPDTPFPDIASTLGWKARLTLKLTQWFLILRSKSWGKWVIGPIVALAIVLAIILAIPAILLIIIFSIFRKPR